MQACQWQELTSRSSCALMIVPDVSRQPLQSLRGLCTVSNLPQAASWQLEAASTAARGPPQKLPFESTND